MSGSTNALQFNPTQSNQESDSTYLADPLRTGGLQLNNVVPSPLLNKVLYQDSTFWFAFATALANKGYTVNDSSPSALEAMFANVLTNADTKPNIITVAYSPNPVFDASQANGFYMALSGNVTGATIVNLTDWQIVTFVIQGLTGLTYTFEWPSNVVGAYPVINTPFPGNAGLNTQTFIALAGILYPITSQLNQLITAFDTLQTEYNALAAGFVSSLVTNGYQKFPGGLTVQWGTATGAGGSGALVTFPVAFSHAVFAILAMPANATANISNYSSGFSLTGFYLVTDGTPVSPSTWIALGW